MKCCCRQLTQLRSFSAPASNRLASIEQNDLFIEELIKEPVLKQQVQVTQSYSERAAMSSFSVPLRANQIENAFFSEFRQIVMRTDWRRYRPLSTCTNTAGRLASEWLLHEKITKNEVPSTEALQSECLVLNMELETGNYERYLKVPDAGGIPAESLNGWNYAVSCVLANPNFHAAFRFDQLDQVRKALTPRRK